MLKYLLPAFLFAIFLAGPAWAADTKISALPAASALTGVEAFPCVQSAATDKCTVTQAVTFTYSLLSGDCTATAGGTITCTKTNSVAFSALATASVPLSIANGGTGQTTLPVSPPGWSDYSTAVFYPVYPMLMSTTAGAAETASKIDCSPGIIPQKMTLAGLSANITTLSAGGNFQLAIYTSSSGRPGALVASTGSGSTASTGFVSPTFAAGSGLSVQVGPGGAQAGANLWFCSNRDNPTVVFSPVIVIAPSALIMSGMIGSATTTTLVSTSADVVALGCVGANCNGGVSTFGTWPASLVGTTWSDIVTLKQPVMFFQPSTIP